jgi:AcrR family transcriptional regulator
MVPMARVTQEHLDARRRQIMTAAARAFAQKGLEPGAATIDDIAVEAELSKGSIYSYFKNKDELLEAIIESAEAADVELFADASKRPGSSWDAFWDVAGRVWDTLLNPDNRERMMLSIERMLVEIRGDRVDSRYVNVPVAGLTELLAGAQNEGKIATDLDPRVLAVALWNCQQGTRAYVLRTGDTETAAAVLELLQDIVGRTAGTSKATGKDAAG